MLPPDVGGRHNTPPPVRDSVGRNISPRLPSTSSSRQSAAVRRLAVLALLGVLALPASPGGAVAPLAAATSPRFADLGTSAAGLFLKLVNDALLGRIDPRAVTYHAPAGLTLDDTVLTDPRGGPVARIKRVEVELNLRALMSGDLAISRVELVEPRLLLEIEDGRLNLLEALSPRKKSESNKPAQGAFRIDDIRVQDGGFRLRDGENVTLTADDIDAFASLEVDLARGSVDVNVRDVAIAAGNVRLKELDIPLRRLRARRVAVRTDVVDVEGVEVDALGGSDGARPAARVAVEGRVRTRDDGLLDLRGTVDAAAGAWPDRLPALAFVTPATKAAVTVRGPFADPRIGIDATFANTTPYDYALDGGTARVDVDRTRVRLQEGTTARVGRGTLRVVGEVVFPAGASPTRLDLRARLADVGLAQVLAPAKLDTPQRGTLSAQAHITGPVGDDDTELTIAGTLTGRGVSLYDVHLPVEVDGDVRVVVTPDRVQLARVRLVDPLGGFVAAVAGPVDLKNERLDLDVDVAAADPTRLLPSLPDALTAGPTTWQGAVAGPWKRVVVEGDAAIERGVAWGVPFARIGARVRVLPDTVEVDGGRGTLAGGLLEQKAPLRIALGKRVNTFTGGRFFVDDADAALLTTPAGEPLPVAGLLDVEATLAGTTAAPRVAVRAAGGGVVVAGERLGAVQTAFTFRDGALDFRLVDVRGPLLHARGSGLRLDTATLRLTGALDVEAVDLGEVASARRVGLRGKGAGSVVVDGDVRAPRVLARLVVRGLAVADWKFGDGPVEAGLRPRVLRPGARPPGADDEAPPLVATLAARTGWDLGHYDVQAAWDIDAETLNANVAIDSVDLSLLHPVLGSSAPLLEGAVSGSATLAGPLDALTGRVRLRVPDVVVHDRNVGADDDAAQGDDRRRPGGATTAGGTAVRLRALGPAFVDVHLDDGDVQAWACAFPDKDARGHDGASPCANAHRLWLTAAGSLAPLAGAVELDIVAQIDEPRVELLVPALGARELGVGAYLRVEAAFQRRADAPVALALRSAVRDLIVRAPGAPTLRLARPTGIELVDGRARLVGRAARFVTAREGVNVEVAADSVVGADDIDLAVEGDIALSLLKLVTSEVANASGTARTRLRVSGRFADGVQLSGSLTPEPGARLTLRSVGQPLIFDVGHIDFEPDAGRPELLRIGFGAACDGGLVGGRAPFSAVGGDDENARRRGRDCALRASLGEGKVQLRGALLARTSRTPEQPWFEGFDLALSGTALDLKTSLGRLEASGDLLLSGDARAPLLAGRVEVSEGLLRRDFELRNFVLSSTPEPPSDPLWRTLAPWGLGELQFDVQASLQNVRAKARINSFSVDASLRGELRLQRSLKLPSLDGAIEVEDGTVEFPRARFDIVEMQVQFPTSAEGRLQPLVHLAARADLPPGSAGNDVEVPVDLAIDGGLEAMQLDLTAVDPGRQWSRTELMAYILFGTIPADNSGTLVGASVAIASRAALRELAAPVSAQLEELVGDAGLDVNIDVVSGWQLQLGRRLVLEGQGILAQSTASTDSTTTTTTSGTTGTDALRVRLLLFDHLPVGRSLSAEGRFGATSDLRLAWRIFEE
jgi:hypothetical protein